MYTHEDAMREHRKNLEQMAEGLKTFGRCCEKAEQFFCVCFISWRCPEHGERHIGTHD